MRIKQFFKLLPLLLFSTLSHANVQQVAPHVLLELIENNQAPFILDVRTAEEFQQGHIKGAVNISHDLLENSTELFKIKKEQPIVVYCRSGRRAQIAYKILDKKGYKQLVDLQGHMILWQQNRFPLEYE